MFMGFSSSSSSLPRGISIKAEEENVLRQQMLHVNRNGSLRLINCAESRRGSSSKTAAAFCRLAD